MQLLILLLYFFNTLNYFSILPIWVILLSFHVELSYYLCFGFKVIAFKLLENAKNLFIVFFWFLRQIISQGCSSSVFPE